ncbi:MAG: hypothetical protein MUF83_21515 [Acidimicrobiales bacterium]|nr:hypothetical protein [Acidimicrobiales bacterium]
MRVKPVDLAEAAVPGARVRLVSGVEGSAGDDHVHLSRWTSFAVRPASSAGAQALIAEFVRPLQDLLVFSLGRSVRLTSLRLLPADLDDPRIGSCEAFFAAVQPPASPNRTFSDVDNYSSPTILSMRTSSLGLEALIPRWFDLWTTRRDVLTLLLAPLYAPFMFGEHGFASTFQSAELLHDDVLTTRDVSKPEHKHRVNEIVRVLEAGDIDPAAVEWASRVLTSRNDKPLARRIEDLIAATGPVGEAILDADPGIGGSSAAARAGVSHGGAAKVLNPTDRYWYGQVLRWVVRVHLLTELLGDATDAQHVVVERKAFRRALNEVRASVARREAEAT